MIRKGFVCVIIILFLSMSIVPSVGSISTETEQSVIKNNLYGIEIYGTMGNNFWYISSVTIILDFGPQAIYYKIDDGEWQIYYTPIIVASDGLHTIYCFYIDPWGNPSETYSASFKIDKTPPTVTVETHRIGLFKILVTMDAYDNTSGVSGVIDIYLDDRLVATITEEPYEFLIQTSPGEHTVSVIVYDDAGNSGEGSSTTPYAKSQKSYLIKNNIQLLNNLLYKFIHNIEN